MKHRITLEEGARPVKEYYRRVPLGLYDEVQKHLQMIDIGAIQPSNNPWVSAVVLGKRMASCFCIDLWMLNSLTVKDAYNIPWIQDTLDCLQGAIWLTLLELKSGYWQVELKEASKALPAFTVGPLRFYECKWMPFGLTNAPATSQHLMEICFGDLQIWWCIIYLVDIIIFAGTLRENLRRLCAVGP